MLKIGFFVRGRKFRNFDELILYTHLANESVDLKFTVADPAIDQEAEKKILVFFIPAERKINFLRRVS